MLEESYNSNINNSSQNQEQIKVHRFKSSKISPLLKHYYKNNNSEIFIRQCHSYDNINKKLDSKLSISKNFPTSYSYSLTSNSKEDIKNIIFKAQSYKYKDFKKMEHIDLKIKKLCSSNIINTGDKLRQKILDLDNINNIKIKRPNFLIKSCFYNDNKGQIYQSKIRRTLSKKEKNSNFSAAFNFFCNNKKIYKLSSFRKNKKKQNNLNENNNNSIIGNDKMLFENNNNEILYYNYNEEFIKIIRADSSDEEQEVKSFYGDNNDFANEIDKINKAKEKDKDKEDIFSNFNNISFKSKINEKNIQNDSKNNSINFNSQNFSEGLSNSMYLNRSLNEDFDFKNHSKIFKSNNYSQSHNNSMIKTHEEKEKEKEKNNFEINNDKSINNRINNCINQNKNNNSFENDIISEIQNNQNNQKNILYQNIINNNNNINQYSFKNDINDININNRINDNNKSNYMNQNNNYQQHPYITNTINYICQNNTILFYNNNPFYMNNNNNISYNYFLPQFNNNINNLHFNNQFNPMINKRNNQRMLNNINNINNNYYKQNNNIFYNNNININPNTNINFNKYKINTNYKNNIEKNNSNIINNNININNNITYSLKDLSKMPIIDLAKNSHIIAKRKEGSKFLENIIQSNPILASNLFFHYSLNYFEEISNNKYGNFYIKKLVKYLNEDCLSKLIKFLSSLMIRLGTNQYGSKILEQLIKKIKDNDDLLQLFIQKIIPNVIVLINDLNGNHIIYKLISLKSERKNLIEENILKNIKSVYISREGSNLLKKYFDIINKYCNNCKDYNKMNFFINIINNNLSLIITDQFGNYLIRHIIHNSNSYYNEILFKNIKNNLIYYSNQKYSSNVIENCLANEKFREYVINEFSDQNKFNCIFLNEYGNYVVQKALNLANEEKKILLFKYIIQASQKLNNFPFGNKLISKLLKNYPKLSMYIGYN